MKTEEFIVPDNVPNKTIRFRFISPQPNITELSIQDYCGGLVVIDAKAAYEVLKNYFEAKND